MAIPTRDLIIRVDFNGHGGWEVDVDDARITCETLDDARRIAFLKAARRPACELVVRDAYHRVVERERIDVVTEARSRS